MESTRVAALISVGIIATGGMLVWLSSSEKLSPAERRLTPPPAPTPVAAATETTVAAAREPSQVSQIGSVVFDDPDPIVAGFLQRSADCALGAFQLSVVQAFNTEAAEARKRGAEAQFFVTSTEVDGAPGIEVMHQMRDDRGVRERRYYYSAEAGEYRYVTAEPDFRPDPLGGQQMRWTCSSANAQRALAGSPAAFADHSNATRGSLNYVSPAREREAPSISQEPSTVATDDGLMDQVGLSN